MDFAFTEQQQVAADSLAQMLSRFRAPPVHAAHYLPGQALDEELEASGFLEICTDPDLGDISAVDLIIQVARLPVAVEVMASTLVRPRIHPDAPRPIALASGTGPVRFGAHARTALIDADGEMLLLELQPGDFEPLDTIFAYPLARLTAAARARARPLSSSDATVLRRYWRIGLSAEITGAMGAGVAAAVDHVTQRKQFGRPIGSFQAVQHRLAEAAVAAEAARWLTLKAAGSGASADAALALGYALTSARRVTYDLHQFHGAMGLTLEHPLHLWTYRLKALFQELAGAAATFRAAAEERWGQPMSVAS